MDFVFLVALAALYAGTQWLLTTVSRLGGAE